MSCVEHLRVHRDFFQRRRLVYGSALDHYIKMRAVLELARKRDTALREIDKQKEAA